MYKIIGADQQVYGPASVEQLRQWIIEGRINAQTQIQLEGAAEWKPLAQFPEFADSLRAQAGPPPLAPAEATVPTLEEVLARDYRLDAGHCISRGWELLKNNFGVLFGGFVVYL